jgi:hypothetical protein
VRLPVRVKLGRKVDVRADSAFPTITDIDARLAIAGITPYLRFCGGIAAQAT